MCPNSWKRVSSSPMAEQRRLAGRGRREVGEDRADRCHVRAVGCPMAEDQLIGRGVRELALSRMQIGVEVGDRAAALAVEDLVQPDRFVPGTGIRHLPVLEPQDFAGEREHALDGRLERQVLGHALLVEPVLLPPQCLVVVAPIPQGDRAVVAIGLHPLTQHIELAGDRSLERGQELLVEGMHAGGRASHLHLHGVIGPRRFAEQRGHPPTQVQRLLQQRPIQVDCLAPVLDQQLPPQLTVVRLLHEWVELRVVEADPVRALARSRRQALDVRVRQAGELVAGDVDAVAEVVEVALEGHLHLDQPGSQPLELGPVRLSELVTRPTEVAQPVRKEPCLLAGQRLPLLGVGERTNDLVEVAPKDECDAPLVDALFRLGSGLPNGGIRMGLAHERAAPVRLHQPRHCQVERDEGRRQRRGAGAGQRRTGELLGVGNGCIGLGRDRCGRDGGVVVQRLSHGIR